MVTELIRIALLVAQLLGTQGLWANADSGFDPCHLSPPSDAVVSIRATGEDVDPIVIEYHLEDGCCGWEVTAYDLQCQRLAGPYMVRGYDRQNSEGE